MFASFSVEIEDLRHESADAAPIVSDRIVSESRSTICFTYEPGEGRGKGEGDATGWVAHGGGRSGRSVMD